VIVLCYENYPPSVGWHCLALSSDVLSNVLIDDRKHQLRFPVLDNGKQPNATSSLSTMMKTGICVGPWLEPKNYFST
jgi:hypothetical protein